RSKTAFISGSLEIIMVLKLLLIFSKSSGLGCAGAGQRGLPNIISTGTGPLTLVGSTTTMSISTLIKGYALLSTWPTNFFAMTGMRPTRSLSTISTFQVTLGTFSGTRPYTSRSNTSTIPGLRVFHHIPGVVTFFPLLVTNISGNSGQ